MVSLGRERNGNMTMKMRRIFGCIFVLALTLVIASRTSTITPAAHAASSGCGSWQGYIVSPSLSGQLFGMAAISQSDIWAVGSIGVNLLVMHYC